MTGWMINDNCIAILFQGVQRVACCSYRDPNPQRFCISWDLSTTGECRARAIVEVYVRQCKTGTERYAKCRS
jgi:hypothetical protein